MNSSSRIFYDRLADCLESKRKLLRFILILFVFTSYIRGDSIKKAIPILCYHRFGTEVSDATTVQTSVFEKHLAWLQTNGYTVISLERAIKYLQEEIQSIPNKSVVITVDDGHKSVYTVMAPLVKKYGIPVTLFIYPSAISNAKYAMTWEQLWELEATMLFRVESHTYWHPHFKEEKKKLSADEYARFVNKQLMVSKQILEKKMGHEIKYLAWPFGIYDDELQTKAAQAGYGAALSIDGRHATSKDSLMAIPRYMIVSKHNIKVFEKMINEDKNGK
ncbi:MAG: polysaccharide deacetylase family protein [Sulfurovum sp.]|nr:polysaccharide deacetylase family protein [Sulfurovum sp.]MDD3602231.1 polysaccharide deacetylase family protein [Sulfurovum sp.]